MKRSNMTDKHIKGLHTRATAVVKRKKDSGIPFFKELTAWANKRWGTRYTVSQVSACLGRRGFLQGRVSGRGMYHSGNAW